MAAKAGGADMKWLARLFGGQAAGNDLARLAAIRQSGQDAPLLQGLSDEQWQQLSLLADTFISSRHWLPQEGLALDGPAMHLLALQACLPVLALPADTMSGWADLVIYPSAFVGRDRWHDEMGLVHEGSTVLIGQARQDGPVLLSLPDTLASVTLDGWNVVIHEMAHKLDMLNGDANGYPPLHKGMDRQAWATDWGRAYQAFNQYLDRGVDDERWAWLDPYAAEEPAEFFAVLSEYFFETPHWLTRWLPDIYKHLTAFYRQSPAERLPDVPLSVLDAPHQGF